MRMVNHLRAEDTVPIKDPVFWGNRVHQVPVKYLASTLGLREYDRCLLRGESPPDHRLRPCMCRLYLEGRCRQGTKCKSFHVDPEYVRELREGVEVKKSFLSEVVVRTPSGTVLAVRYTIVSRTRGLDVYRSNIERGEHGAARLCEHYVEGCPLDTQCPAIHIKASGAKEVATPSKHRTPCCVVHGDVNTHGCEHLDVDGLVLPVSRVAPTKAYLRLKAPLLTASDLCAMHVKSRCKFGRSCSKVHVCREWAEANDIDIPDPLKAKGKATPSPPPQQHPHPMPLALPVPIYTPTHPDEDDDDDIPTLLEESVEIPSIPSWCPEGSFRLTVPPHP